MMWRLVALLFFHFCLAALLAHGQIGVSICACQPSVYTFTFNFSAVCNIGTVDGPGVRGSDCFARGVGTNSANTTDTVPVQVTTVSVLELDRSQRIIAQTSYVQGYRNGDTFMYTSITGTPESVATLTSDTVPAGLQVNIVGINQLEQPITNVWIILFDNNCGIFPVLKIGDQIGWTILVSKSLLYR
jgi:hypothetical protein